MYKTNQLSSHNVLIIEEVGTNFLKINFSTDIIPQTGKNMPIPHNIKDSYEKASTKKIMLKRPKTPTINT